MEGISDWLFFLSFCLACLHALLDDFVTFHVCIMFSASASCRSYNLSGSWAKKLPAASLNSKVLHLSLDQYKCNQNHNHVFAEECRHIQECCQDWSWDRTECMKQNVTRLLMQMDCQMRSKFNNIAAIYFCHFALELNIPEEKQLLELALEEKDVIEQRISTLYRKVSRGQDIVYCSEPCIVGIAVLFPQISTGSCCPTVECSSKTWEGAKAILCNQVTTSKGAIVKEISLLPSGK